MQFGRAAMLNVLLLVGSSKGDCYSVIEIHRMRIPYAHLMVCELFCKTSFVFQKLV